MNVLRRSALALGCVALGCVALLSASLLSGCSKQGEGERCDLNSGSLDCESGLICTPADDLNVPGEGRGVALCCPVDTIQQTVDACRAGSDLPVDPNDPEDPVDAGDGGS